MRNCTCKGCNNGLFKPVRMPRHIYDNVMAFPMPMPIPKHVDVSEITTDLHYLSFADAQKLPFTNEHQPSLSATTLRNAARKMHATMTRQLPLSRVASGPIITKLKNRSNFKIGVSCKVRGVVECLNCHKPRCIYSQAAISQMIPPLLPPGPDDTPSEPITSQQVHLYRAMVKDRLHDAMHSTIYMCGMVALDQDDPRYEVFHCDPSL